VAVWLFAIGDTASAERIHPPQFGTPILVSNRLIFTAPARQWWVAHRIICISSDSGRKEWEITDPSNVQLWFVLSGRFILTVGANVYDCDVNSGKLTLLYNTGYEDCYLNKPQDDSLLVHGSRTNRDFLALVDSVNWQKKWETPRLVGTVADGREVLLCFEATRKPVNGGGYGLVDSHWCGVSKVDGHVLWRCQEYSRGAAVSNYFLVFNYDDGAICLNQNDGSVAARNRALRSRMLGTIESDNGGLLMETLYINFTNLETVPYRLTVPDLDLKRIPMNEWYSATYFPLKGGYAAFADRTNCFSKAQYANSHADGFVYFSKMEDDGAHTTVNRLRLETGEREKLYEEEIPIEMRLKEP